MNLQKILVGTESLTQHYILALRIIMGVFFINHGHELFDSKAMQSFADWLQKDLHFPQPLLMAYLRTGAELFGGFMLLLGLFTRIGAFLIMITMFVAFFTAGKSALLGDGEMVFAYAIVMLTLVLTGSGKISLDYYFFERRR
ncbi:MAG: DoxX family protein [Bacteroidota bacterium]|jgi:putative oxidoreductase